MPEPEAVEQVEEVGEATAPLETSEEEGSTEEGLSEETGEETGEESAAEKDSKKPGHLQKRFNTLSSQRDKAKADAEYWRGVAEGRTQPAPATTTQPQETLKPKQDDYDNEGDYLEALTDWKWEQKLPGLRAAARAEITLEDQQRETQRIQQQHAKKATQAREKYGDYDEMVNQPLFTPTMTQLIMASEVGPEVAYFLGKNPTEADRIAALSQLMVAKEIGKLEVKFSQQPTKRNITKAPAPINPITGGREAVDVPPDKMSTGDYIAKRRREEKGG